MALQEEGDFLRTTPPSSLEPDGSGFSTEGTQHHEVSGLGLRSKVTGLAHPQGTFPSSKGFISAFLEVEEQRGFPKTEGLLP
jgi:hypothetical protein